MNLRFGVAERPLHGDDRWLADPGLGLFGVLDGVGGVARSAEAAELAASTILELCRGSALPPGDALAQACQTASREVMAGELGCTTATLAWIAGREADWISIGDSRLYWKSSAGLRQVSRDQGQGNLVDNVIGALPLPPHGSLTEQRGRIKLLPGDLLVLVTDGITGDFEPDLLTLEELSGAVMGDDPQSMAEALLELARKRDDRTALVVRLD